MYVSCLKQAATYVKLNKKLAKDFYSIKHHHGFMLNLSDRHTAMGDVEAMVNIFVNSPLGDLLHCMKYSSTKER